MTDGWIKLHRKIIDWQWFKDGNVFYLFMNLLLRANITDSKEGLETIKRGEIKTTIPKLSEYTGLTVSQIRTCIDKLKFSGEIAVRISNKYRVITICNFDTYQCDLDNEQQTKSQTNRRQIADKSQTKQEEKEAFPCTPLQEKEENKEESKNKRKQSNDCFRKKFQNLSFEEKQNLFYNELVEYLNQYPADMLREFYDYWSEMSSTIPNKMKCETTDSWETSKRLARWFINYKNKPKIVQQNAKPQQIQF